MQSRSLPSCVTIQTSRQSVFAFGEVRDDVLLVVGIMACWVGTLYGMHYQVKADDVSGIQKVCESSAI